MNTKQRTRTLTLAEAESLVKSDKRYWWDGWTLVQFTPGRGQTYFKRNAIYNRSWRGSHKWGTARRIEIGSDGLYRL